MIAGREILSRSRILPSFNYIFVRKMNWKRAYLSSNTLDEVQENVSSVDTRTFFFFEEEYHLDSEIQ